VELGTALDDFLQRSAGLPPELIGSLRNRSETAQVLSGSQTKRDCGHSAHACRSLQRIDQNGFQASGVKIYEASCDFLIARAVEAKLTDAHCTRIAKDRRTKAPASDRSRRIEITSPGFRVERRTWIVIAEVRNVSCLAGPIANSTCALGIMTFQFGQAFSQAVCIELANLEWSIAALSASRPANQP
jgi:hypothetical protein